MDHEDNDRACISTFTSQSHSQDTSKPKKFNRFDAANGSKRTIFNVKTDHKEYDRNAAHSRKKHKKSCQNYVPRVQPSFQNRKLKEGQLDLLNALLGEGGRRVNFKPASDLRLRCKLGHYMIDEMANLFRANATGATTKFWLATFVHDDFMVNERTGSADVLKIIDKVMSSVRRYSNLSAIGVVENQAITNYPKGKKGKSLSLHIHLVCWGDPSFNPAEFYKRTKGFKSSLTKRPVYFKPMHVSEGSFTKVARYLVKPPYRGKYVDYQDYDQGLPCLRQTTEGLKLYHHLRLLEYSSKLPIKNTLISAREGRKIKARILARLDSWHERKRKSKEVDVSEEAVHQLFVDLLEQNKKLKNYRPMTVRYRR